MKFLFGLFLLCFASSSGFAPAAAQSSAEMAGAVTPWVPVDEETSKIRELAGLKALAIAYPESSNVRLRLLTAQYQAQDFAGMLDTLAWLKARGYVFGEVSQQQIPKLIGEEYTQQARDLLIPVSATIGTSTIITNVPADARLIESVLRDPVDDRLIVTSVIDRAVFGLRPGGEWDGYRFAGVGNLSGIAISPDKQWIWLGAGHIDGSDNATGFAGLIGMGRVGREERRIPAPHGVSLSDITVADEGTVYASDPIGGGVYFTQPEDPELSTLIAPGTFRSPQGLAASSDGAKLYVSDYRYGIAIIDLETKSVARLSSEIPLILDGVDGLWRHGTRLIAMQNGTSPMRIVAFDLSQDGMRVIGHQILEQANPDWTEPLSGSLDGDRLLYVGNGQWDRYVQGEPVPDKPALPTQIRVLPLKP